jgi:hypothetical protein
MAALNDAKQTVTNYEVAPVRVTSILVVFAFGPVYTTDQLRTARPRIIGG